MKREAFIVLDLGFGDAGVGATVDFLIRDRRADLVVRFNGGAQAGHSVVTPDGRRHAFRQFGAGSFVPNVQTYLGPDFVLHPGGMFVEGRELAGKGVDDAFERTFVDARALVTTPFQQAAGRLREVLRGPAAHGTSGVGVGETVVDARTSPHDALCVADLADVDRLAARLRAQQMRKRLDLESAAAQAHPEWKVLSDPEVVERTLEVWARLRESLRVVAPDEARALIGGAAGVVFEGAQGVLLDEAFGFHPHTTWGKCTARGALDLLDGQAFDVQQLGVIRAYSTRHGLGPLPTHDTKWDMALPEAERNDAGWQGTFRCGPLDLVLLRYALDRCGGVDGLVLTCLDRVHNPAPICTGYDVDVTASALVDRNGDGHIVSLRRAEGVSSLAHQERLTALLLHVRPVLDVVPRNELLERIEDDLGVPVLLTSTGPSAADRVRRP